MSLTHTHHFRRSMRLVLTSLMTFLLMQAAYAQPKIKLPKPPKIKTSFSLQHGACGDELNNSAVAINTIFGPYTITSEVWSNSLGLVIGSGSTISNVTPGTYTYQVSGTHNGNGTTVSYSHEIKLGIEVIWTEETVAQPIGNTLIGSETGLPDNSGSGSALSLNEMEYGTPAFASFVFEDLSSNPDDYLALVSFVPPTTGGLTFYGVGVNDAGIGSPNKLELTILNGGSTTGPITIRNDSEVEFSYDGNGTVTIKVALFPSGSSLFAVNLPNQTPFRVGAVLGDSPNSQVKDAIVSFRCPSLSYYELSKKLDANYALLQAGQLLFLYQEQYHDTDGNLEYNIYDATCTNVMSSGSLPESVAYGRNDYTLDIGGNSAFSTGYYVLEVINEKEESWFLRFKVD